MKKAVVVIFLFALACWGCYYDKKEELFPGSQPCDTASVSYSNQVRNIMNGYCVSCHYTGNSTGLYLDTWSGINAVTPTRMMGAVKHLQGFSPMPPSSPKLDDCKIRTLQIWVDAGALNN